MASSSSSFTRGVYCSSPVPVSVSVPACRVAMARGLILFSHIHLEAGASDPTGGWGIENRESSIENRISSIENRASSIGRVGDYTFLAR